MFVMLWIDVNNSVFQFPPIFNNFAQLLKRSRDIPWATINILINSMRRRSVTLVIKW
jgi:hypothetical protein